MTAPIVKADIEAVHGAAEVARWSKGTGNVANDSNVATAIEKAWSEIRSAALNRFTAASFDALTPSTLPPLVKGFAVDLAADWLSSGNRQSGEIDERAERARKWLALLATGYDHVLDDILTVIGSATGGFSARINSPAELTFDRDNTSQRYNRRDPSI